MKKQKLFAMMTVILAMGLAACGGKTSSKESEKPSSAEPTPSSQVQPSSEVTPSSSSEAPKPSSSSSAPQSSQSTPQPSSSSSAPASSSSQPASSSSEVTPPEPVKAVTVSSVNLVAKESKVYLQLVGTATEYTAAEFKWALALQHAGAAGAGDAATTFVLGTTAEFVDEDYKLPATLNDDGSFLFEYNVSDIAGMEAGLLTIHAGVKGLSENLAVGTVNNGATLKDGTYRFYIRADVNSQNTLAVDELPPVTVTEVSIVMDEHDKAWAKIGGVADESITQALLDSFDTFIQFQNTSNWSTTRRYKVGTYTVPGSWGQPDTELTVTEDQYYWKLEGNKAFLYADVSFFAAGGNYNTHMNARHPSQADLKMEVALDEKFTMTNAEGKKLEVNVVAVPGASDQANFWGNLGFKVSAWVDPAAHVHSFPDDADVEYAAGDGYIASRAYNCTGTCGESVLRWNALDFDETLSSGTSKVKVNGSATENAVKTGNAENDGGQNNANPAVSVGNHYVYKINVSDAVAKAGLAFQIYSRSSDLEVFKAQSNDGKRGNYYDEATQTFTAAPARYGVRINGQEVYFDEKLLADEAVTPKNTLVWCDFPLNSFALNKGVNTIDVYSMGGYSQAGILQFQLTGLPKVAVSHKHTLGGWQSDENNHWKECSGEGCTLAPGAHIQEAAHDWGEKYDEVAATCQAKGSYKQKCKVCDYVKTVETEIAAHTLGEAQEKVGNLTPHVCTVCNKTIYELSFADTNPAVSASKLKKDAKWDVTGLPAGTYEVILYACAASTTLPENIRTGNNHDEVGRYQFRFGTGDYTDPTAGTYASFGLGTGESADKCQWTTPLCQLVAAADTAQFEIHWTNKGYSCFIGGVALVKIA